MGRGDYVRWPAPAIELRDAELKSMGLMPKNPKRIAAAWRDAVENGKVSKAVQNKIAALLGPTPSVPMTTKAPKAPKAPKKPKLVAKPKKFKAPAVPTLKQNLDDLKDSYLQPSEPKLRWNDPDIQAYQNDVRNLGELCSAREMLGEFATKEQDQRIAILIDGCLDRVEESTHHCFDREPLPEFMASAPIIQEVPEHTIPTPPPPPPPVRMETPPMPPPAPPMPPSIIPKPPTL